MTKKIAKRVMNVAVSGAVLLAVVSCISEQPGTVGSRTQAITNPQSLSFSGSLKIDSDQELVAGGMNASGVASNVIGIYKKSTDTFTALKDATNVNTVTLPASIVEPDIAAVPGQSNTYAVVAGRTGVDGAGLVNTYVVKLMKDGTHIESSTVVAAGNLAHGRVLSHGSLKQCGTSNLVAFGGMTNKGMQDTSTGRAATDTNEVFTYAAGANGDGAASSWLPLKDNAGSPVEVFLRAKQGYAEVLAKSNNTEFHIIGGMGTGGATSTTVHSKVVVNSSCQVTNATTVLGVRTVPAGATLLDARSRFSSIPVAVRIDSVDYDFLIGGGDNSTANEVRPVTAYLYSTANDSWLASAATNAISVGRLFARFVVSTTANQVKLVTGITPKSTSSFDPWYQTSTAHDIYDYSGTPYTGTKPTWSTGTALSDDRLGAFVELLNGSNVAGFGQYHTTTTGALPVNATGLRTDVITF